MANRTPKKSRNVKETPGTPSTPTTPDFGAFSPVMVTPGRSPCANNLTGIPRIVSDGAVTWNNKAGEWGRNRRRGQELLQQISLTKTSKVSREDVEEDEEEDVSALERAFPASLEEHTDELLKVLASMRDIVGKIERLTEQLKECATLELGRNNGSSYDDPLFRTWDTSEYYDASGKVLQMYKKEFELKETVVNNIAHTTDRDLAMTMIAAWVQEPYIDDHAAFIIESMLHETGHR